MESALIISPWNRFPISMASLDLPVPVAPRITTNDGTIALRKALFTLPADAAMMTLPQRAGDGRCACAVGADVGGRGMFPGNRHPLLVRSDGGPCGGFIVFRHHINMHLLHVFTPSDANEVIYWLIFGRIYRESDSNYLGRWCDWPHYWWWTVDGCLLHGRHLRSFYGNWWVSAAVSKDACCHGDYTAHVTADGKAITHTGGSVAVFHSYQLKADMISSTSRVRQADKERQVLCDIKPNFIILLTYIDWWGTEKRPINKVLGQGIKIHFKPNSERKRRDPQLLLTAEASDRHKSNKCEKKTNHGKPLRRCALL